MNDIIQRPCSILSWLSVSFLLHVKYTLSYRQITWKRYKILQLQTYISIKWHHFQWSSNI